MRNRGNKNLGNHMGYRDGIWYLPWNTTDDIHYILTKINLNIFQTKWNFPLRTIKFQDYLPRGRLRPQRWNPWGDYCRYSPPNSALQADGVAHQGTVVLQTPATRGSDVVGKSSRGGRYGARGGNPGEIFTGGPPQDSASRSKGDASVIT